MLINSSNSALG